MSSEIPCDDLLAAPAIAPPNGDGYGVNHLSSGIRLRAIGAREATNRPDVQSLVASGYENASRVFEGLAGAKPPSSEQVAMILANLSLGQIAEIQAMQNPTLIMDPQLPFARYVESLNADKVRVQADVVLSGGTGIMSDPGEKCEVLGVRVGFIEGAPNLKDGKQGRPDQIIDEFLSQVVPGVSAADARAHALLLKQSLIAGKPIDTTGRSILSSADGTLKSGENNNLSQCGFWFDNGPHYGVLRNNVFYHGENLGVRKMVMAEFPKANHSTEVC